MTISPDAPADAPPQETAPQGIAPDAADAPWIGVVVVTFRAAEFIDQCLESLLAAGWPRLKVMVVDNASPDGTVDAVRGWASGARPFTPPADWPLPPAPPTPKPVPLAEFEGDAAAQAAFDALPTVSLAHSGDNLGFAGGVNVGLRALRAHPQIDLFWVLNPDGVVEPGTPAAYAAAARAGRFGLMGGRTLYFDKPDRIQCDGGRVRWMGFGSSVNMGALAAEAAAPAAETLDYVSGANLVASRAMLDRAGLMDDSWFLYHEELDWALRRGDLPIVAVPRAVIRHRAGASIGSTGHDRLETPFATYFATLNHLRFVRRWNARRLPAAYAASLAVTLKKYVLAGAWPQAEAALRGLHGLPPPRAVRARLSEAIWRRVLGRDPR